MSILKASLIVFCCSVYAGQVQIAQTVNPAATSLYQLCIHELAQQPGADYSAMPLAMQNDLRPLQHNRFAADSLTYEELRARALQGEEFNYCRPVPYSEIAQEAIAFAYEHFPDSDVSCATEVARGYVGSSNAILYGCLAQLCCMGGGLFIANLSHTSYALALKIACTSFPLDGCTICGVMFGLSGLMCLKKRCLDAALPHYNPPRAMQMDLKIAEEPCVQQQGPYPVDEDTSSGEEDAAHGAYIQLYDEETPLLR